MGVWTPFFGTGFHGFLCSIQFRSTSVQLYTQTRFLYHNTQYLSSHKLSPEKMLSAYSSRGIIFWTPCIVIAQVRAGESGRPTAPARGHRIRCYKVQKGRLLNAQAPPPTSPIEALTIFSLLNVQTTTSSPKRYGTDWWTDGRTNVRMARQGNNDKHYAHEPNRKVIYFGRIAPLASRFFSSFSAIVVFL